MVKKTQVVNETTENLTLKEGNAGVYRVYKTLKPVEKCEIDVIEHNATYRDFMAVTDPSGKNVHISTDDCVGTASISIKEDDKGRLTFTKTPRHSLSDVWWTWLHHFNWGVRKE